MRFVYLSTHYSKPMDWTAEKADQAAATLRLWRNLTQGADELIDAQIVEALSDDLNSAGAITRLHALAKAISSNPQKDCHVEKALLLGSARLMGLLQPGMGDWTRKPDLGNWAAKLDALREEAKAMKDFSAVDALKSALIAAGVEVRMSKTGIELDVGPQFDPAKLETLL
jgi:cysteinyl-tRNA synthetase